MAIVAKFYFKSIDYTADISYLFSNLLTKLFLFFIIYALSSPNNTILFPLENYISTI